MPLPYPKPLYIMEYLFITIIVLGIVGIMRGLSRHGIYKMMFGGSGSMVVGYILGYLLSKFGGYIGNIGAAISIAGGIAGTIYFIYDGYNE